MPNHVLTEIVFPNVSSLRQLDILAKVSSRKQDIDFEVLLPLPLNIWRGNVSEKHKKAFPGTALDWRRGNWGTKWNAYGISQGYQSIERTDDSLILRFQTAWSPPMGWLVALFNAFQVSFEYTYLDEGAESAVVGAFRVAVKEFDGDQWSEQKADSSTRRRMHKLLWGVEEFEEGEG